MFRRITALSLCIAKLLVATSAQAAVFISEYVEGSSFNKALEIYNTDTTAFDLGAAGCQIRGYQNGSSTVDWTVNLSGSVAGEDVFVLAHSNASFGGDQTAGNLNFNGDDAVELFCNSATVDVIGQIGTDPGSEWGTGSASTRDNTLRRKVCQGDIDGSNPFDPAVEWDGFPQDTFDGLGSHIATCGPDITPPTITSVSPSTLGPTAATTINFVVAFSESVTDFDDPSDITVNHSGTSHLAANIMQNSPSTYTVAVSGITGTGTLSLTVNSMSVMDLAGNPNVDTLTSPNVSIDPNVMVTTPEGLLLTEIVVVPDNAEFVEIHNTTGDSIDLSDVYLTDATFANGPTYYYQIVMGAGGGGGFGDFHARFPDGASIPAGGYQTIALAGSAAFQAAYGTAPTYELYEDGAPDGIPDMREAFSGSINDQGDLSNGLNNGEVMILYYWDGQSDLVSDLDYLLWGDKVEAVDKTGVSMDGPDGDAVATPYLPDTAISAQTVVDMSEHAGGQSWQRADFSEGTETKTGGNGITGHDESSEGFRLSWGAGTPTPNAVTGMDVSPPGPNLLINEVNAVAAANEEFIEIFDGGAGNTSMNGLSLVLFNDSAQVYSALDLDGISTDGSGYAVIGGSATTPDLLLPVALNDGAAAAAIYIGDPADFPVASGVTTTGLVEAVVYDSGQADVAGLLTLLEAAQPQVDENGNGNAGTESLQRCPNGSGGRRITNTFLAVTPTPGMLNLNCPIGDYYANVVTTDANTLRTTLHQTIDDHQWFPYSSSSTDTWDILEMADEDPSNSSNILDVYKNVSYAKVGGGNPNYNREHTWPRSLGLGQTDTPLNAAATDAHNLRLSDSQYNSDRGSRPFAQCDPNVNASCDERATILTNGMGGGIGVYPGNSNWVTTSDGSTGSWETWHDRRGDVARSIFYMDIRYEGGTHTGTGFAEPTLKITDNRGLIATPDAGVTAYMGLLSTLLQWHIEDPVDSREMERNDVVFLFQGNRNPFVDHPEWVACVYNGVCPSVEEIFSDGFE